MAQLQYAEALKMILEPTDLGYTQKSLDRLWTVFHFDIWSPDEWRGCRLYYTSSGNTYTSYEMWRLELLWTSRAEAEAFARTVRERYDKVLPPAEPAPNVYVINLGDMRRQERGASPKFRGSDRAIAALAVPRKERR